MSFSLFLFFDAKTSTADLFRFFKVLPLEIEKVCASFSSFLSFGTLKLPAIVAKQTERLVLYFCGKMLFARTHVD